MPSPANLIFFLSDNHSRTMLRSFGHPYVETPTMDKIAERGVKFTNAYCASPLCCPSRAALATGRYPHQSGYWDNALAYDGKFPTWHGRVRDQDCTSISIGKLHYVSGENDNGFSEEILPMHIIEGKGALISLLRATPDGVPPRKGPRDMYANSGIGEADYQRYDRDVTKATIDWLGAHAKGRDKPFVLFVSYASPHPPFAVPDRLFDKYPPDKMPLPVQWSHNERPDHPAIAHIRSQDNFEDPITEEYVRQVAAGYCGLVTHLDEQMGEVMKVVEELGLLEDTRILYTSDHGEAAGNHCLFGKSNLYEHSLGVPIVMSGPDITPGSTVTQIASHVDLFPTIVEALGCELSEADADLPGQSLWPAIAGEDSNALGFGEVHVQSTRNAAFMLRAGDDKLIYHVDAPNQFFDLASDPQETRDLIDTPHGEARAAALEETLRTMLDPEETDRRCKTDQLAHAERMGGEDQIRNRGTFNYTPVPGDPLNMETVS
ncbi:MAG: sulfatase [Rhodospirillaceae bacterium]|nr:sulfatase [Rhodospirillaceae bacterium]|tara:strand:- start:178 stop:1647 length:1470 start_codon:yes stop_codon:yes gene_type:complete